jgi:hypothetical protein
MNQEFGQHAFDQAERFFKDAGNVQAIAEKSVAASREFYGMASTVVHDGAKALTEIADTAWGSTKMLNEKMVQNVTSNMSAAFTAAGEIATAKSLPEMVKIQSEYLQKFAAQTAEQAKEFVDLSARASQHVFEKLQTASANSFKAQR